MPLAVTHVLLTIILVDLYRDYYLKNRKYFTLHTIFIAGIGGLLPDIDIPINWILEATGNTISYMNHGGITHTPFFALLFVIPGILLWKKEYQKYACYFFVIAFGIMLHITLDYIIGGGAYEGVMWLFPVSTQTWKLHIISFFQVKDIPAALDAIILILWLWHEEAKHKIKEFF